MSNTVVILGAGVTGLAAAAKFIDMGYKVTLVERRTIGSDIGGGLDIHPNGAKILFSLGIEEALRNICSSNSREIRIGAPENRFLNSIPLNVIEKNEKYPMLSLFRSDLLRILFENIKGRCDCYEQTECTSIRMEEDGVHLSFDHIPPIRADFVIAADGINSLARKTFFPGSEKRYLGHVAMGGKVPRDLYKYNYIHGLRKTCVLFPCTEEKAHTLIFCDKPAGWLKVNAVFEAYRKAFGGWSSEVDKIIDSIAPESRFCVECYEVPPLPTYVFKRIFLTGDAAHAMSPLGALATSVALEDVEELANQFAKRDNQTLEEIGRNYDAKRLPRVKQFREFSLQHLIPAITEHNNDQYQKRIERFHTTPAEQVFAGLVQLTQSEIEPEITIQQNQDVEVKA